jgi:hypothetical protein
VKRPSASVEVAEPVNVMVYAGGFIVSSAKSCFRNEKERNLIARNKEQQGVRQEASDSPNLNTDNVYFKRFSSCIWLPNHPNIVSMEFEYHHPVQE